MKMITWVNHYLMRFNALCFMMLSLTLSVFAYAKVETGSLFVHLSDAMAEIKQGEIAKSTPYLTALQHEFESFPSHSSPAGQAVSSALKFAKQQPDLSRLEQLSKALYAF